MEPPAYRDWAALALDTSEATVSLFFRRPLRSIGLLLLWIIGWSVPVTILGWTQHAYELPAIAAENVETLANMFEVFAIFPTAWLLLALVIAAIHDIDRAQDLMLRKEGDSA